MPASVISAWFSMLKPQLRKGLYQCGVLGLYHRWSNPRNLTVVMFHRVLPVNDPRWSTAEETYTVSDTVFAKCLQFFNRHYFPITLAQLRAARNGSERLPKRPLLVTFDDGWLDNLAVALPILEEHGIPATIFIASSVLDDPSDVWWHDLVVNAWNTGALDTGAFTDFRRAIGLTSEESMDGGWRPGVGLLDILLATARLDVTSREAFLRPLHQSNFFAPPRQMLDQATFQRLAKQRLIEIGAHGDSHLPLTRVEDPGSELMKSKERLERRLDQTSLDEVYSMSFPHGCYDKKLVEQARGLGFELVFTSDAILNPINPMGHSVLGRIGIPSSEILNRKGEFTPDRLATWLFTRESREIEPLR